MKQKRAAIGQKSQPFPDALHKEKLLKSCFRISEKPSKAACPLMSHQHKLVKMIVCWKLQYEVNFRQRLCESS